MYLVDYNLGTGYFFSGSRRLLVLQSDKYPVLPGPATDPAADLDDLSRYVRSLNGARR